MTSTTRWTVAMSFFDRTLPLVRGNVTLFGRDPGPLVGRVTQPVLLVLLMQPLYVSAMGDEARGTAQVVLGELVMFSLLGMSIVGSSILTERRWNTFDRLRATPARAPELLAGKAIPVIGFLLLQQAILLTLGATILGLKIAVPALLLLANLTWAATILCMGAAIAMTVKSLAQFSAVVDIGSTIVAGLSGALVPLSAMPDWARTIAPLWPGYWAMKSLRSAVEGNQNATLVAVAVLLAFATAAAAIAALRLSRGWGRNTLL
jgi:ABC-2 type transport system permease protein